MLTCPAPPIKPADRRPVERANRHGDERANGHGERLPRQPVQDTASRVARNPIVLSW